jgi:hypothetical protein
MSFLYRLLGASLLSCTLAQGANCDPNSTVPVSKEVIALHETVTSLSGDPDVKSTIDMIAATQLRLIGKNDPTWRRENPNWTHVLNQVRDDLNRDVGILLLAQM